MVYDLQTETTFDYYQNINALFQWGSTNNAVYDTRFVNFNNL